MTAPQPLKLFDQDLVHYRVLVPADYNPRRMSAARARQLAASMLKWGLTLPIVAVKRTREIIGGHQRIQRIADLVAAGSLPEDQQVMVIWRDDLSPSDQRKLNIALNEIDGEFVTEEMATLLREIETMDGGSIQDLEAMGLTDDDMKALLDAVDVPAEALANMASEAAPRTGNRDRVVVPAKAYKFSVPTDLAEQYIEPALKAFGHDALVLLGRHGGQVAAFDGPAAAIVAACRFALESRQRDLADEAREEAAQVREDAAEEPEAPPAEAPPAAAPRAKGTRAPRKSRPSRARKAKAG